MKQDSLMLLVPNLALGGQQRVAIHTAHMLRDSKQVIIVVFDGQNAVYETDAEVIDLKIPASGNVISQVLNVFRRVRAIKRIKREREIDCTFSFGTTANLVNALSRVSDRIILSLRGFTSIPSGGFSIRLWRHLFRKSDRVVCVAKDMAEELTQVCDLPKDKAVTLYNPYDVEQVQGMCEVASPIPIQKPTVVSMGRLQDVKGYRHLLRAVAYAKHKIPELRLVLVGEGSIRAQLEEEANRLGILDSVQFAGFQKNPWSIIGKCSCYVLSSIHEGFPNAMVEAMACGIPVIAVDCKTGPREILDCSHPVKEATKCEYGILCPAFESDFYDEPQKDVIFGQAIIDLLTQKELYAAYCQRSEIRARMFSFDQYRERLLQIIFPFED